MDPIRYEEEVDNLDKYDWLPDVFDNPEQIEPSIIYYPWIRPENYMLHVEYVSALKKQAIYLTGNWDYSEEESE